MSNLLNSKTFKVGGLVVAVAMMFVLGGAYDASAQSTVTTTTTVQAAPFVYVQTMRYGMKGPGVATLQAALNTANKGNPTIVVDGSFGPATLAAVKAFQMSKGLVADGVVGPLTGGALSAASVTTVTVATNYPAGCTSASGFSSTTGQPCSGGSNLPAGCTSSAGYSPTTGVKCDSTGTTPTPSPTPSPSGALVGGAGDVTITALSTYGDEEVGEGEEDVKVLAFEVEADDESDVDITSIKVELNQQNTADSEDLEDYVSSVSVWMGDEKVGEVDGDEFSESTGNVWTKSISLDGAIVRSGDTEKFYLAVNALANLDSGDLDSDDWQIGVSNLRFLDADGVSSTESLTLDIDDNQVDDTLEEEFDFATFATASDVELKVSLKDGDEEINEAHVINVETGSTDTDDVEILSFTLEAEGSDINITEIPVLFTTTGEADEAVILKSATLTCGTEEANEAVPTGGAVTFDDLDLDVAAGDEVDCKVTVDLQDLTGALDEGDTVKAELTSTQVDAIDAEDESGEDLAAADLTGTAAGQAHAVYDAGIMVEFVSASATRSSVADAAGEFDQGEFKLTYKITAFDGDMRIDKTCSEDDNQADAGEGTSYLITNTVNNTTTCNLASSTSDSEDTTDVFEVDEDTSRTFTLTVNASVVATGGSDDHFAEVSLEAINWGTATGNTNANFYTFDLGDFKTSTIFLNEF